VLDTEVLENIVAFNDELVSQGRAANQGVKLKLMGPDDKVFFVGDVHPNVQYEYEATSAGQYTLCVSLTEAAFQNGVDMVKTKVKFSAEFHRNRRMKKEKA